jgi:hypothetical protein
VVKVDGTHNLIKDPDKIAECFMNHNITHFSQASGCLLSSKKYQDMTNITQFNELKIPQYSELWHL